MQKRVIGKYNINYYEATGGRYSWETFYTVEVKKGSKVIERKDEEMNYNTNTAKGIVYKKFKEKIEEYKLKAIEEGNYKFLSSDFEVVPKTQNGYEMQRINKYTKEVTKTNLPITTFEGLIRAYIHDKAGKKRVVGHYKIIEDGNKLIYEGSGRQASYGQDVLAIKLKSGKIIGNASLLTRCGSFRRGDEAPAQRVMFDLNMAMIPFSVFEESNMDITKAKIVDKGVEEDFLLPRLAWNERNSMMEPVQIRKRGEQKTKPESNKRRIVTDKKQDYQMEYIKDKEGNLIKDKNGGWKQKRRDYWSFDYIDLTELRERHFVGAMLIQVKNKQFLFDVDRGELPHYRFNPFLSELPRKVKSIEEAYKVLKPKEVRQAEKKGLKVRRQGEWFFIPVKDKFNQPERSSTVVPNRIRYYKKFDLPSSLFMYGEHTTTKTLKEVKETDYYSRLLPKYKKPLLQRFREYNQKVVKFNKEYTKLKEKYDKENQAHQSFRWGGNIQAGDNRPNRVSHLYMDLKNDKTYCKGKVSHTGREHEDIQLEGWHLAVPNTATKSFTISGNID